MKLLSCHVENFGKLSNVSFDFTNGVNLFYQPNGWGKSTLAAFLRVMFYGFDSKRESGQFDKERVVYRPWQGGVYGGTLDFNYKDRVYRISRSFGKNEKTDTFHIYDLATTLECHDYSSDIGNEIFGLDSASFKRSAFIAQNDCECGSTDAINAKLGNLVENTNDINNFDTAQKRIRDRMNKISPNRATGSLKKRKSTITLLTEEIRGFEAADTAAKEIREKLAKKQEQRKELSDIRSQYAKALQMASEESRRESLKMNYDSLCREVDERKAEMDSYRRIFPDRVPEEEEFIQKNQEVQMLGVLKTTLYNLGLTDEERTQYSKLSDRFENGLPDQQDISEMEKELECLSQLHEEKSLLENRISYFEAMAMKREAPIFLVEKRIPLLVFGIMLIAAGGIGCVLSFVLKNLLKDFIPVMVIAAGVVVFGILLLLVRSIRMSQDERRNQKRKLEREEEDRKFREPVIEVQQTLELASAEILKIEEKAIAFLGRYHIYCSGTNAREGMFDLKNQMHEYDRLKTRANKSEAAREEYEKTKKDLMEFGEETGVDFGEDLGTGISLLQTKATKYRIALKAYEESRKKKELFEEEYDVKELEQKEVCPYSLDELNSMIQDVDERLEDVREAIEQYNRQMDDLQEQLDMRDEKEQQLTTCKEEQEKEEHLYEVYDLTQSLLQSAKEQFSARYLGPIEGGFGKYYELLTGSGKGTWMVDANIDVQVKELGELRETKWFSAGYQDLLGVCMRLALVDAMYPEEKPFLVLDDPFVNQDEEKFGHGQELLKQIANEYQVLYFTCNASRNIGKS